jgi:hypothetical protein
MCPPQRVTSRHGCICSWAIECRRGAGNDLAYSTYLGGSDHDEGNAITVDSQGNAYITGDTWSTDFPLLNPLQGTLKGSPDVFVTKLTAAGALDSSTYLAGDYFDKGCGIAVDSRGNAYVTRYTDSADFPAVNPFQGVRKGEMDGFVTKLNFPINIPRSTVPIAGGEKHSLALKNGSVRAWGSNRWGQSTVPAAAKSGISAASAGAGHSLALKADGAVLAWGDNSYGQCNVPRNSLTPVLALLLGD